jgi:hypothetical protein
LLEVVIGILYFSLFHITTIVHVGHIHLLWIFLIDEDIRFDKFDAFVVNTDLHIEIGAQKLKEHLSLNVGIQSICLTSKYQQGPKEINEHSIHNRIVIDRFLDFDPSLSQNSKELHDQLFELEIIEYLRIIFLIEHKLEVLIVDDLLDLTDV